MQAVKHISPVLLGLLLTAAPPGGLANNSLANTPGIADGTSALPGKEATWALGFENDVLAGGNRDKDYTYGLNLTVTTHDRDDIRFSPLPLQEWIDRHTLSTPTLNTGYSLEAGVYGFTPDDIEVAAPIPDDRPYASLVYLQSSREQVDMQRGIGWTSSLSIGVLGLDLVGSGQNQVHSFTDSNEAQGWDHQISNGGELTAKYTLARQRYWTSATPGFELKTTTQFSVGYITEVSSSLSFRAGNLGSSWWSFDPDLASYGEHSNPTRSTPRIAEHYFWAGLTLKARAYNVFLQGQFRQSDVTFDGDEVNHLLVEAWAGYTIGFRNGYRISYYLRGHSSEIESGQGDRSLLWGGLIFSKRF